MNLSAIVTQIRNTSNCFNAVIGISTEELAQTLVNLPSPAAIVVPVSGRASENRSLNDYQQLLTETFKVLVVIDNTPDRTGLLAEQDVFYTIQKALYQSLNKFKYTNKSRKGCYTTGYETNLIRADKAYFEFNFECEIWLDDDDSISGNPIILAEFAPNISNVIANVVVTTTTGNATGLNTTVNFSETINI